MPHNHQIVNSIAPLTNVAMLHAATKRAQTYCRENGGMFVVFHGHAGYGKTTACNYVRGKERGYRVECCDHWGRKAVLQAILYEMSIPAAHNINDMFNQVVDQLRNSGRTLFLDEADHLAKNSCIEMVRGIMDKSRIVVVLSGEEMLPRKLERWERIHSRILEPVAALPSSLEDLGHLARLYCPGIEIANDWLTELHIQTGGNTRRVVVNLNRARNEAEVIGDINLKGWGNRGWYTGKSPSPRRAV